MRRPSRPQARRKSVRSQRNASRPRPRTRRSGTAAERKALLCTVETTVHALIYVREWDALAAVVKQFAAILAMPPRHLLARALWRYPIEYQGQTKPGIELLMKPPAFVEAMARLRRATEHRRALLAFQALESEGAGVH